jgi:hypothetical protein
MPDMSGVDAVRCLRQVRSVSEDPYADDARRSKNRPYDVSKPALPATYQGCSYLAASLRCKTDRGGVE